MPHYRINVSADTDAGDKRVAQAHVSMIAATLTVGKGDSFTWISRHGPFRITFTGECPFPGSSVISSRKGRGGYRTDALKGHTVGSFDYVIQLGKAADLAKSSC